MTALASSEELREFLGGEDITGPRAEKLLDYASAVVRAYLRDEPNLSEQDRDLVKGVVLQVAGRAFTMNKGSQFEEFGGAVSEASGFAPEMVLYRHELRALINLTHVGIG